MKPVELFHVGPQKCGTTWIYQCMREHPEVAAPKSDSIHYFDINFFRGRRWFAEHFKQARDGQKLFDPSFTYVRSIPATQRIKDENANALIAISMRHPIERAFSHYWHEKKKSRYNFVFSEVLKNYDLFANWIEPGFYAGHLERYFDFFPRKQILAQFHSQMATDPHAFIKELFSFYGLDPDFTPSVVGNRVNVARPKDFSGYKTGRNAKRFGQAALSAVGLRAAVPYVRKFIDSPNLGNRCGDTSVGYMEYLYEESPAFLEDLMSLCITEIERLESLLDVDLTEWRSIEMLKKTNAK